MNMKRSLVPVVCGFVIAFCPLYLFYLSSRAGLPAIGSEPPIAISVVTNETIVSSYADTASTSITTDTEQDAAPKTPDNQTYTAATESIHVSGDVANDVSITPTSERNTEDSGHAGEDSASPTTSASPATSAIPTTIITANGKTAVRFLYLVQTEICLPPDLRANEVLGNGSLDFHVLVLSYRQPCDDRSLSHVEYIFDASTTWTTGRNLLFTIAMKRNTTYLYYIFMDDDATVFDLRTNAVAWRAFEGFLQAMEPAIMALDLPGVQDYSERVLQIHKDRGCFMEELEYVTGLWYDAMVNAFHYKAVRHLLPYVSTFDQQTWWASQMALIVKTEILFRGQLVLHRYIRCRGSQNRPYPRDLNFTPDMYSVFTQGLDAHIAAGCVSVCARTMIDNWMKFGSDNGWTSSTLCLPTPPPHDPVEPCRYQCYLL